MPALALALGADEALLEDFPVGSIRSVSQAERVLERLPVARNEIDQRYARDRADCHERFFVSSCLTEVQQRQRDARTRVRKVEVEARAFLRRDKAAGRDRALAERAEKGGRSIPLSGATRDTGGAEATEE